MNPDCDIGNSKILVDHPDSAGMDELLAVLGYKVKSSDMADVAQNLEQLDMAMAMATSSAPVDSVISSDIVHYNPSDISGWVKSVLSDFTNDFTNDNSSNASLISFSNGLPSDDSQAKFIRDDDLRAIFGNKRKDLIGDSDTGSVKRMKMESSSRSEESFSENQAPARPVVRMDSQETGIRLVHTLMACAEAVHVDDLKLADALVKHVSILAAVQTGAMRKVATYFAEGLNRKIYNTYPKDSMDPSYSDGLHLQFYQRTPYLKFAHFTANHAIMEAVAGASSIHIIDFSLKQGMQWPELMQALVQRPEGPPALFRVTGIGLPQPDNRDALQQVGWKLAELAETIGVKFEFRGLVTNSLEDVDAEVVQVREPEETVVVSSVLELHRLLAREGAIERVLSNIKGMKPKVVTVVEQEASHNGEGGYVERFNSALQYYSTMFDSMEEEKEMGEVEEYVGHEICNVVGCEGMMRVERHETLMEWIGRMKSAGLESVKMGSDAHKRATLLVKHFTKGDGYGVQEKDGCLLLGWHTRPLLAASAWRLPHPNPKPPPLNLPSRV